MRARSAWMLALLGCASACVLADFDELGETTPVTTLAWEFPGAPASTIAVALTVAPDDEVRGRVLLGDGEGAIAWYRIDEQGGGDRRSASAAELAALAGVEAPAITGLAVVDGVAVAEGLVRFAATDELPDRVVRFRIADFSRPSEAALDMIVYPHVGDPPALLGPLAAVQLDDGRAEALSGTAEGLIIWDALGTSSADYLDARAALLADDPTVFDADPDEGLGLTRCPGLVPTAIAGGRLRGDQARAAAALEGATVTLIGPASPPEISLVGAPIYACALATLTLPGEAETIFVGDLGGDGDDDLLVGAPALGEVWVFENLGDGLGSSPSFTLASAEPGEFGAAIDLVELGGDAPPLIVVGAPGTTIDGEAEVGRVHLFDARDGARLRTLEELDPRPGSRHGLGVHGLEVPGREELVVSGARELRIHWRTLPEDPGP